MWYSYEIYKKRNHIFRNFTLTNLERKIDLGISSFCTDVCWQDLFQFEKKKLDWDKKWNVWCKNELWRYLLIKSDNDSNNKSHTDYQKITMIKWN